MKKGRFGRLAIILFPIGLVACQQGSESAMLTSPDGNLKISFKLDKGRAYYAVSENDTAIIQFSKLGFRMGNMPDLDKDFTLIGTARDSMDNTWEQPWGEKRYIRDHYNQLTVSLQEKHNLKRRLNIIFRAFDDGVGFRYEIPAQENVDSIRIMDEETEFNMPAVEHAWWIPAAYKHNSYYEDLYQYTPINRMDTVHTPLTIETTSGMYLSIHEASLTDYAAMTIYCEDSSRLKCILEPWSDGVAVYAKAPMVTPWRTVQVGHTPGDLITSCLILNLNEPSKIKDVSWIKPCKYIGIWWGMHLGIYTWGQGPHHGATTARVMRYIDFAAANGFDGVLVEGWNEGWDGNWPENGNVFSFTKAYPDFDLPKLAAYAASKHVKIIGHHETAAAVANYERQMDSAFRLYQHYGIDQVKTGYVGRLMNGKEWHDGQFGVDHYRRVIETAAKYRIMIDNHEPVKPTGLQRTWPNLMTQEGARGQEYNAWSADGGNPPEHTTILPFTRMLGGPLDFTPGVFNFDNPGHPGTRVRTTIAKQLALYVVIYSPMQMACDLPENYENNKKAFDFIKVVPVDWEVTKVLNGKIGDYVTIARKDRNSDDWYVGSITDENSRELKIDLTFLDKGREYIARIWADGSKADWKTNPTDFQYEEKTVTSDSVLTIRLAASGGQAIRFSKKIKG